MKIKNKVKFSSIIKAEFTQIFVFIVILTISGCNSTDLVNPENDKKPPELSPKVEIITLTPQSVVMKTELSGRTTPYLIAEVRPQITGIIQQRLFKEGSQIKKGEVLYQIDEAIYKANFNSAKAALAKSEANLKITALKEQRYKKLITKNAVSQHEYDDAYATYQQALATVSVDQALLQSASINLNYTRVNSPISGRIGRSSITPGALVTANQENELAVVQQLDPIYVDLSQSSMEILRLRQMLMAFGQSISNELGVEVQLILENGESYAYKGELEFSEVTVDPGMGSITLRAVFPNPDHLLLPGMFVRAKVETANLDNALMIPAKALSRDIKGRPVVMILNQKNTVEARILDSVELIDGQWLVHQGLKAGEQLIVSGLQYIRPGMMAQAIRNDSINHDNQVSLK